MGAIVKMKICIVMVDNRPVDGRLMTAEYNSVVACINANYAEKNGYDFCYYILTAGAGGGVNCVVDPWKRGVLRHAAWGKILAMRHHIQERARGEYDYVVYVDSDCAFVGGGNARRIEDIVEECMTDESVHTVFLNNYPQNPEYPNTGFFICKVGDEAVKFLDKWFTTKEDTGSEEWGQITESQRRAWAVECPHPSGIAHKDIDVEPWEYGRYWEQDAMWLMVHREGNYRTLGIKLFCKEVMFFPTDGQMLLHLYSPYGNETRKHVFVQYLRKLGIAHRYHTIADELVKNKVVEIDFTK